VHDGEFLPLLHECADAIAGAITDQRRRGFSGLRPTQYHLDLAADEAALAVLCRAGVRVVSEESGVTGEGDVTIVIDPVDGSTNCDRGIPFYATSLAVMVDGRVTEGLVVNLATGTRYWASTGRGAFRNGELIASSGQTDVGKSLVSHSGVPQRHLGWYQMRALGAASLECCLVADGSLDLFVVAPTSAVHPWDYLAGLLIAREAGAVAVDVDGLVLETEATEARHPIFAATSELLADYLMRARQYPATAGA
jgi:myo-inositol-1(or 4)-monophosphatase